MFMAVLLWNIGSEQMNSLKIVLAFAVLSIFLSLAIPVASKTSASIIVNGAASLRQDSLTKNQPLLDSLIDVTDRIIVQFANHLQSETLAYPIDFFNDNPPPQINNIAAQGMGIITWTTDEYATSTVIYGTQIVVDTAEITNPLFTKQHQVTLTGLTPGETYKYQVRSTDRSGNTSTSSEHSFTAKESQSIYLPYVVGNR